MKKWLLATALFFLTSAAQAGMYVSGSIGYQFNNASKTNFMDPMTMQNVKYKYDNAAMVTGAVGYAFPIMPFRVEIESLYTKSEVKEKQGHMTSYGLMAYAYFRVPLIGLYAGAGAGYASVKDERTPLYQGMLGVEYGLFGLNIGVEYRHMQSTKDVKKFMEESSLRNDLIMLKARYEF